MIKYALKCAENHSFESWFQSADAFDKLAASGLISCPDCADTRISKAIMAPKIQAKRRLEGPETPVSHALTAPQSEAATALAELKQKVESHSEYVGRDFADEARAIHEGVAEERSIYGEANGKEARKLLEDGIPVAPLPFTPTRKTN